MADTVRGWWPNEECLDCRQKGVSFLHWGHLVPDSVEGVAKLCGDCIQKRHKYFEKNAVPMPVGFSGEI